MPDFSSIQLIINPIAIVCYAVDGYRPRGTRDLNRLSGGQFSKRQDSALKVLNAPHAQPLQRRRSMRIPINHEPVSPQGIDPF